MILWSVTFTGDFLHNPADTETFAATDFVSLCEMIGECRLNNVTRIIQYGPVTIQTPSMGDY